MKGIPVVRIQPIRSEICSLQSEIFLDGVFSAPHLDVDQAKIRALAIVGGFDGNDVLVLLGTNF